MIDAQRVLDFWFGRPDSEAFGRPRPVWFRKDPEFDAAVRAELGPEFDAARNGPHDAWAASAADCLALVILLDQVPRNLFRADARAFACDRRAWQIAARGVGSGLDRELSPVHRQFLYMPYQHAEDLAIQHRSVHLFCELGLQDAFVFAIAHRRIIERFGRFPHRNAILGRPSTPEEIEFLREPGSSF